MIARGERCSLLVERRLSQRPQVKDHPRPHSSFDPRTSKRMIRALVASALLGSSAALELTEKNWDAETAGKSVFIKFLAPW